MQIFKKIKENLFKIKANILILQTSRYWMALKEFKGMIQERLQIGHRRCGI